MMDDSKLLHTRLSRPPCFVATSRIRTRNAGRRISVRTCKCELLKSWRAEGNRPLLTFCGLMAIMQRFINRTVGGCIPQKISKMANWFYVQPRAYQIVSLQVLLSRSDHTLKQANAISFKRSCYSDTSDRDMINTNDRIQSSSMWESGTGGRQNKNCDRLGGLGVAWVTRGRGLQCPSLLRITSFSR